MKPANGPFYHLIRSFDLDAGTAETLTLSTSQKIDKSYQIYRFILNLDPGFDHTRNTVLL